MCMAAEAGPLPASNGLRSSQEYWTLTCAEPRFVDLNERSEPVSVSS